MVRVLKLRRMRWGERVACIGEKRKAYKSFGEKTLKEIGVYEELGVDGMYIFYRNRMGGSGID